MAQERRDRTTGPVSVEHELARLGRDEVHHRQGEPPVTCRHCGEPLVWVPDVGWVVDEPAGSYDLCEGDPLGLHDPGPV
jgi:hypothetical protein